MGADINFGPNLQLDKNFVQVYIQRLVIQTVILTKSNQIYSKPRKLFCALNMQCSRDHKCATKDVIEEHSERHYKYCIHLYIISKIRTSLKSERYHADELQNLWPVMKVVDTDIKTTPNELF